MASSTPEVTLTQTHVFRVSSDMHRLELISPTAWRQIVHHALPLQPANAAVRLLIIRGTAPNPAENAGAYCESAQCRSIDALQLQTDSFGFLLTWDASDTQSLPALTSRAQEHPEPNPERQANENKPGKIIDSRQRFLRRYLSHRHNWQPSPPLIAEALIRSGYSTAVPDLTH